MESMKKSTRTTTPFLVGHRFNPTEEELISYYLKYKIIKGQSPPSWKTVMVERDLYGEKATPWELFRDDDDLPWHIVVDTSSKVAKSEKVLYVLTKLSSFGSRNKHRVAGCGTWHVNNGVCDVRANNGKGKKIGTRRNLTFRSKEETVGQWTMYEYALDAAFYGVKGSTNCEDYVICKIKKDDSKTSKGGKLVRNRVDSMTDDTVEQENHENRKKPKPSAYCSEAAGFMNDNIKILRPTPLVVIDDDEQVDDQVMSDGISGEINCTINRERRQRED